MERREFLKGTAVAVTGVGLMALPALGEEAKAQAKAGPPMMVAACGLACTVCPAMIAGKCKGCATGRTATPEMLKKPCPVLQCAAGKQLDYCGNCKMFTTCAKLIGRPYDQAFVAMLAKKLGA
jgi:hypothetical protein